MAQPYVGEVRLFAGNFAPAGWMFCDGQLVSIAEYETLFVLIGTTFGGDGEETFALPDMRGRVPVHQGTGLGRSFILGQSGGQESVTLTSQQIPAHTHSLLGSKDPASARSVSGGVFGRTPADVYASEFDPVQLSYQSIATKGGSQPHDNMQPFLCVSYIISMFGIFPSQ